MDERCNVLRVRVPSSPYTIEYKKKRPLNFQQLKYQGRFLRFFGKDLEKL